MRLHPILALVAGLSLPGCRPAFREVMQKHMDELYARGNAEALEQSYSAELREWAKAEQKRLLAEYENPRITIDEFVWRGPRSAVVYTFTGTHKASGKKVQYKGISFMRTAPGGAIDEEYRYWDTLAEKEALGYLVVGSGAEVASEGADSAETANEEDARPEEAPEDATSQDPADPAEDDPAGKLGGEQPTATPTGNAPEPNPLDRPATSEKQDAPKADHVQFDYSDEDEE